MKHYVLKLRTGRDPQALMQRIEGRKAMDVLAGLCLGILADGEISSREAAFLEEWIKAHAHSLPAFVGAKLVPKLHLLGRESDMSDEIVEELVSVLYDMVGMGDHGQNVGKVDLVESAGLPCRLVFDPVDHPISVANEEVVVSGEFENHTRTEIMEVLERLGAMPRDASPTVRTRYVIVGRKGSGSWVSRNLGRKIERALELREKGQDLRIIDETAFFRFAAPGDFKPR